MTKSFLYQDATTNNMSPGSDVIDILKAVLLQISIWYWEIRMIAKFGWDWGYKETEKS